MSKLGFGIPRLMGLAPNVKRWIQSNSGIPWQMTDQYYFRMCDLRKIEIPAILHYDNRSSGDHQIELIGSDTMLYKQALEVVGRIVIGDPEYLRTTRLDLSVDVPEVSLDWFYTHVRIPRKKTLKIWGKHSKHRDQGTTGFHYGGTRDMVRIYDKLEELGRREKPINFPFASWDPTAPPQTITRVERQLRGERIPSTLRHLGNLRRIADYNPFNQIRFEEPRRLAFGKAPVRTVLASMGYQQLVEHEGLAAATLLLNKASPGNASRLRKTFLADTTGKPDLYAIFQVETLAQMGDT